MANGQEQLSMVPVCIDASPALWANGHGWRIPCAFRLMSMRLALAVEGRTNAVARPVKLARAEA